MQEKNNLEQQGQTWLKQLSADVKDLAQFNQLALLFNDPGFLKFIEKSSEAQNQIRNLFIKKIPSWKKDKTNVLEILVKNKALIEILKKLDPPFVLSLEHYGYTIFELLKSLPNNHHPFIKELKSNPEFLFILEVKIIKALIKEDRYFHEFFVKNLEKFIKKFGFRSFFDKQDFRGPGLDFSILLFKPDSNAENQQKYLASRLLPLVNYYPKSGKKRLKSFSWMILINDIFRHFL